MGKKLLIVIGSMGRGGAERVVSHISEYFAVHGWRVWIVMLLANKVDYALHPNVQTVDLSGATASRWKRLPYWLVGLRKLMREIQPDSVLSFAARINIITQLAGLGLGMKITGSERNDPFSDGRSRYVDALTKWLYPKAHAVVFQTKRAATYLPQLKNACIIPNPVAVQCAAEEAKAGKIVTVGRLTAQKNQKMLIEAFSHLQQRHPKAELHIFGEGELREALTKQIDELGLEESVFLRGNVLDIHQQIKDAAVFALPSDYEGLSNALLEAMMMGLPCVSTNCAGSDEYIVDGENGLLVPVGDEAALEAALDRLLLHRDEAQRFGKAAAAVAAALQKERIMEQWYSVME